MIKQLMLSLALASVISGCSMEPPQWAVNKHTNDPAHLKVGLSISTLNNPFFVAVKDGVADSAQQEHIMLKVADAQNDSAKQSNDIEDLIQQKVDILVVNPVDSGAVSAAITDANQAGIPVITIDRSADHGQVASFIASDNVAGGKLAANYIISKLGAGAKVAELQGIPGASATRERGQGFHSIADHQLTVLASQAADFDRAKGLTVSENLIQAHDNLQAIFAQNDEMALGAVEAVKSSGKNIIIVGFDGSQDGIAAVKSGQMSATIAQQPAIIGHQAIQVAKQIASKQPVAAKIAIPLKVVTN